MAPKAGGTNVTGFTSRNVSGSKQINTISSYFPSGRASLGDNTNSMQNVNLGGRADMNAKSNKDKAAG